jgi:hypothetical protein
MSSSVSDPLEESRRRMCSRCNRDIGPQRLMFTAAKQVLLRQAGLQLRELQSLETEAAPTYKAATHSLPHGNLTRDLRKGRIRAENSAGGCGCMSRPITAGVVLRNQCLCDRDWSCPVGNVGTNTPGRASDFFVRCMKRRISSITELSQILPEQTFVGLVHVVYCRSSDPGSFVLKVP